MRLEDLIKKLETLQVPNTEIQSHRSRLKMALYQAAYLQKQSKPPLSEALKFKLKGVLNSMNTGAAILRKPAYAIVIAFAVLLTLTMGVPVVRAEIINTVSGWFSIQNPDGQGTMTWQHTFDFQPYSPAYVPAGWRMAENMMAGEEGYYILGTYYTGKNMYDGTSSRNFNEGDQFAALFQKKTSADTTLPLGESRNIKGYQAVLQQGTAISFEYSTYSSDIAKWLEKELQSPGVKKLTWVQGTTQLELVSNLSEAQLLEIAESMKPATLVQSAK